MIITSRLFEAHLKCPTKCFLRSGPETGNGNEYADWERTQNEKYRDAEVNRLMAECAQGESVIGPLDTDSLKGAKKWRLAFNATVRWHDLESTIHAIERLPSEGRGQAALFVPSRFVPANKATKDDMLLLAFDALVLSEVIGQDITHGRIIHGDDHAVLKVKTRALVGDVRKIIGKVSALLSDPTPPDLVLNRHCAECDFRDRCLPKAVEKDDLSLLDRMTPKLARKYQKKGIFTVEQLSYLFRPRKNKKRPPTLRFSPELQALAIRTNKTYIQELPSYTRPPVELFLDFEGIPDERFNYLIGLLISNGQSATYRSFWADSKTNEQTIWKELIDAASQYPDSPIYHYGSYESKAVKDFIQQYGASSGIMERLVNVNSWIYGKVYFPVRSNSLKELGKYLGARWTAPNASGLISLVWRQRWEESGDDHHKQLLLTYNEEDCRALRLLVEIVSGLKDNAESHPTVELASSPKRQATKTGNEIHGQFD